MEGNRVMKYRVTASAVAVLGLLVAACTSSNTPTQTTQSNASYDSQFREQTRSAAQNYQSGGQLDENKTDQPVTIMLLSMETGDVHPGEDYYVYAVVDDPQKRANLQYTWSVANGDVSEVPESERGRLMTIVENEYQTSGTAGPQTATETGAVGTEGGGAQAPPGAAPPSGFQRPGGAGATGAAGAAGRGFGTGPVAGGTSTGGVPANPGTGPPPEGGGAGADITPPGAGATPGSGPEKVVRSDSGDNTGSETDQEQTDKEKADQQKSDAESTGGDQSEGSGDATGSEDPQPGKESASVMERRMVAGPDSESQGDDEGASSDDQSDTKDAADKTDETDDSQDASEQSRANVEGPAEVAERISQGAESANALRNDAVLAGEPDDNAPLAEQYEKWKEGEGEFRRQPLGPYGNDTETEKVASDESYQESSFTTDEPFILWTPKMPGETTIYMKVTYKGEDLTDPRSLDVTVRLKDPTVELSTDFPEVVREDEYVFVKLEADNIPSFYKGLFTLEYDFNKLSFRDAELGDFFDDSPSASLYYAQPDKTAGKVLLAIDSNTELVNLSGSGELVYVKFKAKEDIGDMADTGLTLVSDASARYILDRNGENVLPQPVDYPIFRTSVTAPPQLATFNRQNTPGAPVTGGTQPGAGAQPGGTQAGGSLAQQTQGASRPGTPTTGGAGIPLGPGLTGGTTGTQSGTQTPIPLGPGAGGVAPGTGGVSQGVTGGVSEGVGTSGDRIVNDTGQEQQPAESQGEFVGPKQPAQPGSQEPVVNEEANVALINAIRDASLESMIDALRQGADPNWIDPQSGKTALHMAVLDGNLAEVHTLLSRGADRNLLSSEGKSAIDYATENNLTDILDELQNAPVVTR